MARIITENDLLLFHYKEVEPEFHNHILAQISYNPQWQDYLKLLSDIDNCLNTESNTPSKTTISIILEESLHQENPTF
jgi:hypothetical protein